MKRFGLVLLTSLALVGGALGTNAAHADEAYPPGGGATVTPSSGVSGQSMTITLTGFCSATVQITIAGPTPASFTVPTNGGTFVAGLPGGYNLTASGDITCPKATLEPAVASATLAAVVSASFTVTAAATTTTTDDVGSGGPVPTTTAPIATTTTLTASEAPVGDTTTTAVLAAPSSGSLPTTGSDTNYTLQLALALAAGGIVLLVVARIRRQQRIA